MPPVTASPDLIASMPHWLQVLLVLLGAIVPVASLVASILNAYVRAAKAREERVPTWMLAVTGAVNLAALNPDKSVEQAKAATTPRCPKCGKELQAALSAVGFGLACPSCFQNGNNSGATP